MGTDPEPDDRLSLLKTNSSPVETDAHGVDGLVRMNPLELDPGMSRVFLPKQITLAPPAPHIDRELFEQAAESCGDMRPHSSSKPRSSVRPARYSSKASAANCSS